MSKRDAVAVIVGAHCCGYVPGPGIAPDSLAYATQHREFHIARWPKSTAETRINLDKLVAIATKKKRALVEAIKRSASTVLVVALPTTGRIMLDDIAGELANNATMMALLALGEEP